MTTTAEDVHLFVWIKENSPFLGPLALLFFGMIAGWVKVMLSRYPTRKEIHLTMDEKIEASQAQCEKQFIRLERDQHDIVEAISRLRVELLSRADAIDKDNKGEHSDIRKYIQNQTSLILDHWKQPGRR